MEAGGVWKPSILVGGSLSVTTEVPSRPAGPHPTPGDGSPGVSRVGSGGEAPAAGGTGGLRPPLTGGQFSEPGALFSAGQLGWGEGPCRERAS